MKCDRMVWTKRAERGVFEMKFSTLNTPRAMAVELGSRLRVARLNRNLTQEQVGNSAGISRYIVKELENEALQEGETILQKLID